MNNDSEAAQPSITFDMSAVPPSAEALNRHRRNTEAVIRINEKRRLHGLWLGNLFRGCVIITILLQVFVSQTKYRPWISSGVFAIFAILFIIAYFFFDSKENSASRRVRAAESMLFDLTEISVDNDLDRCVKWLYMVENSGVVREYQHQLVHLGRMPVAGEYESALAFVADEKARLDSAKQSQLMQDTRNRMVSDPI